MKSLKYLLSSLLVVFVMNMNYAIVTVGTVPADQPTKENVISKAKVKLDAMLASGELTAKETRKVERAKKLMERFERIVAKKDAKLAKKNAKRVAKGKKAKASDNKWLWVALGCLGAGVLLMILTVILGTATLSAGLVLTLWALSVLAFLASTVFFIVWLVNR